MIEKPSEVKLGSLTVAGLGIGLGQMTYEAQLAISSADVVLCLATNPVSGEVLNRLNRNVRSLHACYAEGKPRPDSYEDMVRIVLSEVRAGKTVCFAVYGHPGVFANPTHTAVRRAREEGFPAVMLPGISAEDCAYADLGFDPSSSGCQSFEATDFLLRDRIWDPYSFLLLWQVSVVGIISLPASGEETPGLRFLKDKLVSAYGHDHAGILYEASCYPGCEHRADVKKLSELAPSDFKPETTMVIPPLEGCPRRNTEFEKLIRWSGTPS